MTKYIGSYHIALVNLPEIHTDLLWYLTIFFCGLGAVYFVFVFFFRNNLSKKASSIADRKRELAPVISQFLFLDDDASTEERIKYLSQKVEVRELIKTKFNREVLSEILLDLQKDVAGEARHNLYELYKGLGLHYDAYAKLKNWRWEIVSQGILELTQMRVEESYMFIRRFINHRKGVVRKQAQVATVSLKNEGIGYFLDTCRYNISEWQQLKLLDVLRHLEEFTPPRFKIWLTSKNKDVVLFALRLIRYYNQNDANLAIIQLLKHRNHQIKAEAILCLKEFGVTDSIDTLKSVFRKSDTEEKIAILDAIGAMGTKEDIEFLTKVEYTDDNFTVRSKAISAINTIDPESIVPSDGIREPSAADIRFAEESVDNNADTGDLSADLQQTELQFDPEHEVENTHEEIPVLQTEVQNEELVPNTENEEILDRQEEIELPELLEENEFIFDMCVMEELEDIIVDVNREEEAAYLPLNFLPIVQDNQEQLPKADENTKPEDAIERKNDEKNFKKDLDAILKNITMKDKRNKAKTEEEIPYFLPRVVENEDKPEEVESSDDFNELEVISETISDREPDLQESLLEEEYQEYQETINETPVIAETVPWSDMVPNAPSLTENLAEEIADDDVLSEGLLGFCIFHEMFRDFDVESKLILLDEILVVGEEKELIFLGTLADDPDRRIRKKAMKIKSQLADKLKIKKQEEEPEIAHAVQDSDDYFGEAEQDILEDSAFDEIMEEELNEKLPLEYCLYEGAINELLESNDIDPYLDIDSNNIESGIMEVSQPIDEDMPKEKVKKKSILENLFAPKPKGPKNG